MRAVAAGVSVAIPALNEESCIGATIDAAVAAGAIEVIVADGGSTDATVSVARAHGASIVSGEAVRARQMNAAAATASGEAILFLHADTILPPGATAAVTRAIEEGAIFGGFHLAFLEAGLDRVARRINARTRFTREPWGDQAQFVRRDLFLRAGGYRDMPIMEDYELARRMKRLGPTVVLPLTVRTSGRRFLSRGLVRTAVINWTIVAAYHLGVSPERLARWYRRP